MQIQKVINNLDQTISGKEELLSKMEFGIVNQFIKINIDELKRIREDLQKVKLTQNSS
jgi:hypothetical protein